MNSSESSASAPQAAPAPVTASTPAPTASPDPAAAKAANPMAAPAAAASPAAAAPPTDVSAPTASPTSASGAPATTAAAPAVVGAVPPPAVANTAVGSSTLASAPSPAMTVAATAPAPPTATAPSAPAVAPAVSSHGATSPPQQRPSDAPSQEPAAKSVVVPRCSTWFSLDAINPIEKRMLPEFFVRTGTNGGATSKTPQIYIKYRNFMVHAYRQQPHVYLTATACRRNLAGDACAILRVHEFLTHWGLINYSVPPHAMPPSTHPNYALKPATTATAAVPSGTLLAVLPDATAPATTSALRARACETCGVGAVAFELSPDAKRKAADAAANGSGTAPTSGAGAAAATANSSTGKELVLGAFCVTPGAGLCDDCYLNRSAFPDGVDAADFVRVQPPAQWTPAETNALLDAVAASGRDAEESCDWNIVAAKVRTKTASECMLRFLELPILQHAAGDASGAGGASGALGGDVLQRPFAYAQAMNAPVLDMTALLAHVDPFVAKAAARAAIDAVKQLHAMPAGGTATTDAAVKREGGATTGTSSSSSLEQAASAVAASAVVAGIADPVKAEVGADGDVEMTSVGDATTESVNSERVAVTKEIVAVAHEASSATAAALLAVRAHAIADATATGPVHDLVRELLQNQLAQMELKMQQLSVLERAVAAEKDAVAQAKYALYVERLAFVQEKLGGQGAAAASTSAGAQ